MAITKDTCQQFRKTLQKKFAPTSIDTIINQITRLSKKTDINNPYEVNETINHPEKGCNARIIPISEKLINQINRLKTNNGKLFTLTENGAQHNLHYIRNKATKLHANENYKKIHFHTFRHWKATMEYHKTKDIVHVKTLLGHTNIDSTMIYINIEQAMFLQTNDQWTTKTATTIEQAQRLIEVGFEYVTEIDNTKIFKKRK